MVFYLNLVQYQVAAHLDLRSILTERPGSWTQPGHP
jgi:hypothetical protein